MDLWWWPRLSWWKWRGRRSLSDRMQGTPVQMQQWPVSIFFGVYWKVTITVLLKSTTGVIFLCTWFIKRNLKCRCVPGTARCSGNAECSDESDEFEWGQENDDDIDDYVNIDDDIDDDWNVMLKVRGSRHWRVWRPLWGRRALPYSWTGSGRMVMMMMMVMTIMMMMTMMMMIHCQCLYKDYYHRQS